MATDPVIVVDARRASQSQIVSPQVLPYIWRTKFSTLIRDVATTATQDPVFSIQITNAYLAFHTTEGDKEMLSISTWVSPLIAACKSFASVGKVMSLGCTVVSTVTRAKSLVHSAPLSCATRKLSARRSSSLPPEALAPMAQIRALVRKLVLSSDRNPKSRFRDSGS